jgi:hypothetical protein
MFLKNNNKICLLNHKKTPHLPHFLIIDVHSDSVRTNNGNWLDFVPILKYLFKTWRLWKTIASSVSDKRINGPPIFYRKNIEKRI